MLALKLASHARLDCTTPASKRINRLPAMADFAFRATKRLFPISKMKTALLRLILTRRSRLRIGKRKPEILEPAAIGFHYDAVELDVKVFFGVFATGIVELCIVVGDEGGEVAGRCLVSVGVIVLLLLFFLVVFLFFLVVFASIGLRR